MAAKYKINLKPVILFKAQHTVKQSKKNKKEFHKLIDNLTAAQIANIRQSDIGLVQRAFQFFDKNGISDEQLVGRLKQEFQEEYCLSANEKDERNEHQILVNTLEDRDNRIRAIFAVQKLSEWLGCPESVRYCPLQHHPQHKYGGPRVTLQLAKRS